MSALWQSPAGADGHRLSRGLVILFMRLFEAIIEANHRAVAGDTNAGLHPDDFAEELPVVALTCIDPRLNGFFPSAMGLPPEQFIWLRNAGNIITGPLSSTMRSLALACAVKGGREIAIIGHTDCQVAKTSTMVLLDRLKALGVDRARLPENLSDFFGTFGSERQNVIKAVDFVRGSPLIGIKVAVHGLVIDVNNGKLDWVVNGYEAMNRPSLPGVSGTNGLPSFAKLEELGHYQDFHLGDMKFPDSKIGDHAFAGKPEVVPVSPPPTTSASTPPGWPTTGQPATLPPVKPMIPPSTIFVPSANAVSIPPPLKKTPLPPIRHKPPLNPQKDFKRGER